MTHTLRSFRMLVVAAALCAGLASWPAPAGAQTFNGQATAVTSAIPGLSAALADTGLASSSDEARQAALQTGSIPLLLSGEVMHATTITWPDQAASEASLGGLVLSLAGNGISADFVMARAEAVSGSSGVGQSLVDGLVVNGVPHSVSGAPNEVVPLFGGRLIINEQQLSSTGSVVNALHLFIDGVGDVVLGSAKAGTWSTSGSGSSPLPLPLPIGL